MDSKLSREAVATAAVDIARAHGVSGVTMRRIAGVLDVQTMTLYGYVKDKDDLLWAMVEHLCGADKASDLRVDPNAHVLAQDLVRARRVVAISTRLIPEAP